MAYWTISFMTIDNRSIRITIDGKSGNTDQALTPASNPFETQEEGKNDLFVPVLVQTGYIRIVTDDIDLLRTIIPTSGGTRAVTAYQTTGGVTTVIWKGYVQPKLLSFRIWNGVQTVAIPVECCLSALKYKTAGVTANYPYINETLVMMMAPYSWDYWYFQCSALSTPNYDADLLWLNKRISTSSISGRSYLDILKDICTFYGWTCRTAGNNIYFIQNRNVNAVIGSSLYRVTTSVVSSISGTPESPTGALWHTVTAANGAFADDKSKMIMYEGVRRVVVSSPIMPYDVEFAMDISDFKQAIYDGTWAPQKITVGDTYYYEAFNNITIGSMVISGYNAYGELGPQQPGQYDIQDRTMAIHVLITDRTSENPYLGWITLTTTQTYSFTAGKISFKFDDASTNIEFTFKIGSLWYKWNGNGSNGEWVENEPTEINNHINYDPASPFGDTANIYFDENLTGAVTIKVYDPSGLTGVEDVSFSNITVTYTPETSEGYNSDVTEITHSQLTGVEFSDEKKIESTFALREGTASLSQNFVLNADLTPCLALYDDPSDPTAFNPLQRLTEEAAAELANVGELVEVNMLGSVQGNVSPITKMYMSWLNEYYYPLSISRDWRNDIIKLILIKRVTS